MMSSILQLERIARVEKPRQVQNAFVLTFVKRKNNNNNKDYLLFYLKKSLQTLQFNLKGLS